MIRHPIHPIFLGTSLRPGHYRQYDDFRMRARLGSMDNDVCPGHYGGLMQTSPLPSASIYLLLCLFPQTKFDAAYETTIWLLSQRELIE